MYLGHFGLPDANKVERLMQSPRFVGNRKVVSGETIRKADLFVR
jgi:hypothetical protein